MGNARGEQAYQRLQPWLFFRDTTPSRRTCSPGISSSATCSRDPPLSSPEREAPFLQEKEEPTEGVTLLSFGGQ